MKGAFAVKNRACGLWSSLDPAWATFRENKPATWRLLTRPAQLTPKERDRVRPDVAKYLQELDIAGSNEAAGARMNTLAKRNNILIEPKREEVQEAFRGIACGKIREIKADFNFIFGAGRLLVPSLFSFVPLSARKENANRKDLEKLNANIPSCIIELNALDQRVFGGSVTLLSKKLSERSWIEMTVRPAEQFRGGLHAEIMRAILNLTVFPAIEKFALPEFPADSEYFDSLQSRHSYSYIQGRTEMTNLIRQ